MNAKQTFTISNGTDLTVIAMEAKGFNSVDKDLASNLYMAAKYAKEKFDIVGRVLIQIYNSDTIEIEGQAAFACYRPKHREIHMAVGMPDVDIINGFEMTKDEWREYLYRRLFHEMYHQFQHQEGWSDKPDDFLEDEAEWNAVELVQQYFAEPFEERNP
jgi:hypothetical protein